MHITTNMDTQAGFSSALWLKEMDCYGCTGGEIRSPAPLSEYGRSPSSMTVVAAA